MYNLNDASFNAIEGKAVFNNGNAGVVENVTVSVKKKTAEDKENAPDYKLVFTDANGGSCDMSFWYVTAATEYSSIEEQVKKQGTKMKHVIHAIYGQDYQIPVNATNAKELLDQSMKVIRDGLQNPAKFRVFANYGTNSSVKNYIQPRSWVPFIESANVPATETRLKVGNLDAMARLDADTPNVATKTAPAQTAATVDGDDW